MLSRTTFAGACAHDGSPDLVPPLSIAHACRWSTRLKSDEDEICQLLEAVGTPRGPKWWALSTMKHLRETMDFFKNELKDIGERKNLQAALSTLADFASRK